MSVGSLFAGIGGFDLGLERAGFHVKWQVEVNEYCNRVLAKHWPHVRRYADITGVEWSCVEPVDLVCGGFPCQPFSLAGKRRGAADDRYLWPEVVRCLSTVRPAWFFGENVPGIITLALDQVYVDLENLGYTVAAFSVPACAVDAPHERNRLWLVAHTNSQRLEGVHHTRDEKCMQLLAGQIRQEWVPEPNMDRVAYGIPDRVDRLQGLGNAIVPQIAEAFGRMIMEVTYGDRTDGADERG